MSARRASWSRRRPVTRTGPRRPRLPQSGQLRRRAAVEPAPAAARARALPRPPPSRRLRRRRGGCAAGDSHPVRATARLGRVARARAAGDRDPVRAAARRRRPASRPAGAAGRRKAVRRRRHAGPGDGARGVRRRGPERHRRAEQAGRPAHDPRRREVRRAHGRRRHARRLRVPAHAGAPLPGRARGRRRRRASRPGPRASWRRRSRSRRSHAGGVVESSLYESVQKSGESTALVGLLVELFAWDVNFYIDTHPGDRWKVVVEKQYLGGQFYKYGRVLAAEYGGKVGHVPRVLLGGQGRAPRSPRQVLRREGAGGLQDDAEDAAALRAHQLEVRSQAAAPDPARRARPPGHRLRGAGRHARLGVGQRPRRRGRQ